MGKAITFMLFMWLMVCLGAGVMSGSIEVANTRLTADITAVSDTLPVADTTGLPDSGIVVIEGEHIAYSQKTDTSLYGLVTAPLVRGVDDTEAEVHLSGTMVTTIPGSMLNNSFSYNIAVITDTAGMQSFLSAPLAFFRLLKGFFTAPLEFLGTNLSIISYLWMILGISIVVTISISVLGGRRV